MSNIFKHVFYLTKGQKSIGIQSAVRSEEWEADYLIKTCSRVQKNLYYLLDKKPTESDELLMICRSMMLDVIGVSDFLRYLKVEYNENLDDYNSMYLQNKNIENLFKKVRNGLAHTTVGDGLLHTACKVSGKLAVPYYFLQGRDALFKYKFKINSYSPEDDFCFGCGHFRISVLNHLMPYLKFSFDELKKYNQPFQGNKKEMQIEIKVLE